MTKSLPHATGGAKSIVLTSSLFHLFIYLIYLFVCLFIYLFTLIQKILLIVAFLAAVNSQSDDNEDEGSRSQINSAALAEESKATQGATLVRPDTKANCNWKEPGYYKECFPAPDWTHPDPNVIQIIPTEFTDVWWW